MKPEREAGQIKKYHVTQPGAMALTHLKCVHLGTSNLTWTYVCVLDE